MITIQSVNMAFGHKSNKRAKWIGPQARQAAMQIRHSDSPAITTAEAANDRFAQQLLEQFGEDVVKSSVFEKAQHHKKTLQAEKRRRYGNRRRKTL